MIIDFIIYSLVILTVRNDSKLIAKSSSLFYSFVEGCKRKPLSFIQITVIGISKGRKEKTRSEIIDLSKVKYTIHI